MNFTNCNGLTIHYKWIDNKKGKNFLFINPLGTDYRIWDEVVEKLQEYGNVLLFDKRGHGLSDTANETKGLEDYLNDVVFLCQHLSIEKCTVVGLSVGGMIAQLLAYHHPGKVEKLILCDTRHKIGNAQIWNERIVAVKGHGIQNILDGVIQRWFSKSFQFNQPDKAAGYKNMLERTPALGYIQTCEAIRDADLTEIAKQIKVPAICIVGSEDKSTTVEEVKALADLIKGSIFKVMQGSGHIPCVDNPVALSKLIIEFVKK